MKSRIICIRRTAAVFTNWQAKHKRKADFDIFFLFVFIPFFFLLLYFIFAFKRIELSFAYMTFPKRIRLCGNDNHLHKVQTSTIVRFFFFEFFCCLHIHFSHFHIDRVVFVILSIVMCTPSEFYSFWDSNNDKNTIC